MMFNFATRSTGRLAPTSAQTELGPVALQRLKPSQQTALMALMAGFSVSQAAAEVNVDRTTIHRWLAHPDFAAALRTLQYEFRRSITARLHASAEKAAQCVDRAISRGDAGGGGRGTVRQCNRG